MANTQIKITNQTGQEVMAQTTFGNENKIRLKVSSLNAGIYIVSIYHNNSCIRKKFIKK
jgi:hypothetical protein